MSSGLTGTQGAKDVKIAINTQDPEVARRFLKVVYQVDLDFATGPTATTGNLTKETKLFNLGERTCPITYPRSPRFQVR